MTTTVRTTTLEVYVHDGVEWQYDTTAYAVSCSFGFDQRFAEATVRRTGGGLIAVNYWSPVEIKLGCTPGAGAATRFKGYVVPVENAVYPIDSVLTCKGVLYRAQWVRNQTPGGTVMAEPPTGAPDEAQVQAILTACAVPFTASNIAGTGKALGSEAFDFSNPTVPGPFTWGEGASGLDYIEQLDAVSVPDDASGRFRTFETLGGDVFRIAMATAPASTPDFSFAEGVDVLEARLTRDPAGAANRVTVTGAPTPLGGSVPGVEGLDVYRFTAGTSAAPYLPPGLPNGPDGYPALTATFASPLIEKALVVDPDVAGDVLSCEAVAAFLLQEHNAVLDTLEFATPRDDLLGPGQTVHLHSPRLAVTDPDQHYWLQRLEITLDERGAFTQRLTCLRRS
jgi:hypothetical protein